MYGALISFNNNWKIQYRRYFIVCTSYNHSYSNEKNDQNIDPQKYLKDNSETTNGEGAQGISQKVVNNFRLSQVTKVKNFNKKAN